MKNEAQIRVIYLWKYLYSHTDDSHPVSVQDILKHWSSLGIEASRKSVYHDIDILIALGVDIVCVRSTQNHYFIGDRLFELPELKLLVDAVESSRFITSKKSGDLIRKLGQLTSSAQAEQLDRHIYMDGMPKPSNEAIYYIVDTIQSSIQSNPRQRESVETPRVPLSVHSLCPDLESGSLLCGGMVRKTYETFSVPGGPYDVGGDDGSARPPAPWF